MAVAGSRGEVPEGLRILAGGQTAPAVAAPGNGRRKVSVLKGRREERCI